MAYWKLVTVVETDDEDGVWTEQMIRDKIMQDSNRGDGMYIEAHKQCHLEIIST